MNSVQLFGVLKEEPNIQCSQQTGNFFGMMTLLISRFAGKDKPPLIEEVDVKLWGHAVNTMRGVQPGALVLVEGRVTTSSGVSQRDGSSWRKVAIDPVEVKITGYARPPQNMALPPVQITPQPAPAAAMPWSFDGMDDVPF